MSIKEEILEIFQIKSPPKFRASWAFPGASPARSNRSPQITRGAAFPPPEQQTQQISLPEKSSQGSRMAGGCCLSGSLRCILNKRHLEGCAYPNPSARKSKAHKHLFKAALTYRVFKLFTAAACETQQNVQGCFFWVFFPSKILFPPPSPGGFDVPVKSWECLWLRWKKVIWGRNMALLTSCKATADVTVRRCWIFIWRGKGKIYLLVKWSLLQSA